MQLNTTFYAQARKVFRSKLTKICLKKNLIYDALQQHSSREWRESLRQATRRREEILSKSLMQSLQFTRKLTSQTSFNATNKGNRLTWYLAVGACTTVGCIGGFVAYQSLFKPSLNVPETDTITADSFKPMRVVETKSLNHDTAFVRIRAIAADTVPIISHIDVLDPSCQVFRSYTPIRYGPDFLDLVVKRYPDGLMSNLIHNKMAGDILEIRGPIVELPYARNSVKEIGMIAGGSGITPFFQLIERVLQDDGDHTHLTLIYANKTQEDVLLKEELDVLQRQYPARLSIHYTLDKPATWFSRAQLGVGLQVLKTHLPKFEAAILVCGPEELVQEVAGLKPAESKQGELSGHLKTLNFNPQQVYKF